MENSIKNRIIQLMESEQLNAGAFARAIDVNPAAISHILNERNKPSMEILTKILTTFRTINSEWLILGVGAMYKSDEQAVSAVSEPSLFDQPAAQNYTAAPLQSLFDAPQVAQTQQPVAQESPRTHPMIQEPIPPTVIEKEIIKEVMIQAPEKKLQKVIVYYSDNSFEEFLPAM